eukprot:8128626-Pyramimonas_sp.AAC.1
MPPRCQYRHTTHTFRDLVGAPPKVQVAQPACVPAADFCTPFTRLVTAYGAPPKVPVVQPACVPATHIGTPLLRFSGAARARPSHKFWHSPHIFVTPWELHSKFPWE